MDKSENQIGMPFANDDQLVELVKLFEGFNQASSSFSQSYRALEQRIAQLSGQLEEQSRMLERTEGFLSSVLAHVPVGILVIDMDGRITLFNEEAENLTGHSAIEVVGQRYFEIFPCDVNEPDSGLYTLTNGTMIDPREKDIILRNGERSPVRFSTSWIFGDNGQPIGVLEVFENMQQIRSLQESMQQSANLASLGEMAAQVAHELRNPLAGVQGFAQFLIEDIEPEHPARPIAEKIIIGVKDINHIASRLLEFTRPMTPSLADVDLIALLGEEVDLARAEAKHNYPDTEIRVHLPDERISVYCDGNLLKQAVLNLLKNSMQALPDGGVIEMILAWDLLRNRVRIIIKDNGIGISKENVHKIFNPFFTTRTKGTGLGLSMVKKIIDSHYGTIIVKSSPESGTSFIVELPITRG